MRSASTRHLLFRVPSLIISISPSAAHRVDRTTAEFPVALGKGVVFRIVGQLRPGHTIPGSVGGGYLLQMQPVEWFVIHGVTIYG